METALLVAFIAVAITAVSSVVDFIQTWHIRKVQTKLNEVSSQWQEGGSVGEQFGDWLMDKEGDDKPTNLQIAAAQVGSVIAQSFSNATKGILSGDARRARAIERGITEIVEENLSPDQKAIKGLAQRVGELIGLDVSPSEVAFIAQRLGLGNVLGKDHQNNGEQREW